MEHTKLARSIEQWQNCDPNVMAMKQSLPAIANAFIDAKHDILALKAQRDELLDGFAKLLDAADDSDGGFYGTLSTRFVRGIAAPLFNKHKEASHG